MKWKKINGWYGLVLVVAVFVSAAVPVRADNDTYTEDGSASCTVTATLQSTYTVSLPAALALSYDSSEEVYKGSFSYGVKGNIAMDKKIAISAPTSFNLTGAASSDTVAATLSLPFKEWSNDAESGENAQISVSSFVLKTGTVTANITQADSYSGNFSFTFGMQDK